MSDAGGESPMPLTESTLTELLRVAERAQEVAPGPYGLSETNFITRKFSDNDPNTGIAVAEIDCYNDFEGVGRHVAAHFTTFDPTTCANLVCRLMSAEAEVVRLTSQNERLDSMMLTLCQWMENAARSKP